ncbi:MAG: TIGR01777 family oxidoreductase [candidate division Zixibacteria bacterium]|nr:TIGR01777 family oxidoreductase [candidate division Zixibacteria bacterium]
MKIALTGASGMIGGHLIPLLKSDGHTTMRLVRHSENSGQDTIQWDIEKKKLNPADLEGVDAIIHLAGENIAAKRWMATVKEKIKSSRVGGTSLLAETIARMERKPAVFISVSAIGYYGDRGDDPLTEQSPPGKGFLSEVCQAWESEADPAKQHGVRVVHPRIGIILTKKGGALKKMLPPFKAGIGGKLGDGCQYMSWIAFDDLLDIFRFVLADKTLDGPINAVSPNPVTNERFTKVLAKILHRPSALTVPKFALKALLGSEMAQELLLASAKVSPEKLRNAGFTFRYSSLEEALAKALESD